MESQFESQVLGDLTHETLEWQLADEEVRRLLVMANLAQSHCARTETMRLLHLTDTHRHTHSR